jgi:alkylhydroperoxidase/carboxymuconolactone decarboxylase family protein YurZ
MSKLPRPPKTFEEFSARFPELRQAWDLAGDAGRNGPLDEKSQRLIKLAVGIGAMREGAVHSSARKALAAGATAEEMNQVVALAASVTGFPSAVAAYTWVRDVLAETGD